MKEMLKKMKSGMPKGAPSSEEEQMLASDIPEIEIEIGEGEQMAQGEGEEQGDDEMDVAQPVPMALQKLIDSGEVTAEALQAALEKLQSAPEEMELA